MLEVLEVNEFEPLFRKIFLTKIDPFCCRSKDGFKFSLASFCDALDRLLRHFNIPHSLYVVVTQKDPYLSYCVILTYRVAQRR